MTATTPTPTKYYNPATNEVATSESLSKIVGYSIVYNPSIVRQLGFYPMQEEYPSFDPMFYVLDRTTLEKVFSEETQSYTFVYKIVPKDFDSVKARLIKRVYKHYEEKVQQILDASQTSALLLSLNLPVEHAAYQEERSLIDAAVTSLNLNLFLLDNAASVEELNSIVLD